MLQRGKDREKVVVVVHIFMCFLTIVIQAWWPTHQLCSQGCVWITLTLPAPHWVALKGGSSLGVRYHGYLGTQISWPVVTFVNKISARSGLASLCPVERAGTWLSSATPGHVQDRQVMMVWGRLLLLSQQKVFSCDRVSWCPVNLKPYSKSSYHFALLPARAIHERFMKKKQESRAEEDTWNFREKKAWGNA